MLTQSLAFDPPFYGRLSLSRKKSFFSKNFDDVIACDLRFSLLSPETKILATPMYLVNVFLLTLITFD